MAIKDILNVIPIVHSATLVDTNIRLTKKKKKKAGDFIGAASNTIVGTSLITAESNIIGGL